MSQLTDTLNKVVLRYKELEEKLLVSGLSGSDYSKLAKERSDIEPLHDLAVRYFNLLDERKDLQGMLVDANTEEGIKQMAQEELLLNEASVASIEHEIKVTLLPKDADDEKSAIIEVRAGTGGEEAALFAANLFRMYQRYVESKKAWKFEILYASETGLDGLKEASASITGSGVFSKLKFESGVHRVQRVPETESSGRIHTSAATVAVLPAAEEVDIEIAEGDLQIDVYRASGAGGQHVNTTESAVRIRHIPSGITVAIQDERSQHKNKDKAMKILRSRVYELEREKKDAARAAMRKGQIGGGDRSERIRTYNYPQSRITDHRVNLTVHNLTEVINDGKLDVIIDTLITADQIAKLQELE